jgi:uncharacterized protein (DUF2384 family)
MKRSRPAKSPSAQSAKRRLGCRTRGIGPTLSSSGANKQLTTQEQAKLIRRASEVLGGYAAAEHWLTNAIPSLGGSTPLDYAVRNGADEVLNILGRIEHGIWS